jgi:hypothetical protein
MRSPARLHRALETLVPAVIVLLALVGLVTLSGCGGSGSAATTGTSASATSTPAAPATPSTEPQTTTTAAAPMEWGATGTWEGISITAAEPRTDATPESVDAGNKVVYAMVKMVNNSKGAYDYNGLEFTLLDTDHQAYDSFGLTSMPDLGSGTLAPGGSVEGAVAFELPSGATPGGLAWQPSSAPAPQLIWGRQ